ncbi:helix-turn-helix domain-containing protein [Streptomyces sp. Act143]|uniref:helix-turn-helix domain-containing protein n=1 Tax=Streptomyces sp. Act143 TaxID=2200760 RepID=UPI000D684004|nr:helix-turn-helix domain-containing protein [Streptomyces sp. Act143]PWI16340.1 helix-turn-helix domain-containing protein [Streptomyces sp. Act143]
MDTRNPSAPSRAQSRTTGKNHPHSGGLIHENTRHTARFTVIGNPLAQHPDLSLVAIGLATHIQSLPKGAQVCIKSLTARFKEGSTRIAGAMRELKTHGYLRREVERVSGGRVISRTISCNQPGARRDRTHTEPAPPKKPHLAPGVAAWLEREVPATLVREALTRDLPPEPLHRPAALLAHRLAAQLPPLPPPYRAPAPKPAGPHPWQECPGCHHPFRAPAPGRCRGCRTDLPEAT